MAKTRITAAELKAEMQRRIDVLIGDHRWVEAPSPQPADWGPYLANWTINELGPSWPVCDQIVGIAAELMMEFDLA